MARQEIILGTPPQGIGGDPPRTASMKINAMTLELFAALGAEGGSLPAVLPAAKGGTGNTTGTAARLATGGMVGPVSQTGGAATGAIIERGANANGDYIRFADGTQICWKRIATDSSNNPVGAIFGSNAFGAGAFPAAFSEVPKVTHSGYIATGAVNAMWSASYTPPAQTNWGNYRMLSAGAYGPGFIDAVAIGRWY